MRSFLTCPGGVPPDIEERFTSTFTPKEQLYIKASMKGMFCVNLLMNTVARLRSGKRSPSGTRKPIAGQSRLASVSRGRAAPGKATEREDAPEDSRFPADLRYHREHMWVREDGTVGLTFYAQEQLGEIVFLEVRDPGSRIRAGEVLGSLESIKAVSDLHSPVCGTVAEVNGKALEAPELLNLDPYGAGWIARLELQDPAELEGLLSAAEYRDLVCGG